MDKHIGKKEREWTEREKMNVVKYEHLVGLLEGHMLVVLFLELFCKFQIFQINTWGKTSLLFLLSLEWNTLQSKATRQCFPLSQAWVLNAREPVGQGSDTMAVRAEPQSLSTVRALEVESVERAHSVWQWPSGHSRGGRTIRRGAVSEEIEDPLH